MIKQPILGTLLNPSNISSESPLVEPRRGQGLPKEANGFAQLFASEAHAQKNTDGKIVAIKPLNSDIRLTHEMLEKMADQGVDEKTAKELDIEAVLQQINQDMTDPKITPSAIDAESSDAMMIPLTVADTNKVPSELVVTPLESPHIEKPLNGQVKLVGAPQAKELTVSSVDDFATEENLKRQTKQTVLDDVAKPVKTGKSEMDIIVSPDNNAVTKADITTISPDVNSVPEMDAAKVSSDANLVTDAITSKRSPITDPVINDIASDDELAFMSKPSVQTSDNFVENTLKQSPVVEDSTERFFQSTKNSDMPQQAEQVVQQSVQQVMNENQAVPAQHVNAAQSSQGHVSSQQPASSNSVSAQSAFPQNMGASSNQPVFEQGTGQQGQSGQQGQQGHSSQSQQQHLQQQVQAFAQVQKQDIARAQQEGVRAFNDVLVSEEAKTEKSEKLLGSLGLSLEGKNQLPPGLQTLSQPMRSPQWGQALGQRITYMISNKVQEAKITLNPEKLGSIQIKLNIDKDNQLHVSMTTQHGTTREAIENAMPRLREILDDAGIGLGSLDIKDENAFAKEQHQDASDSKANNSSNASLTDEAEEGMTGTEHTELASDHLVDYYA